MTNVELVAPALLALLIVGMLFFLFREEPRVVLRCECTAVDGGAR